MLLADDHTLVRSGIRRILEGEPGIEVLAKPATAPARSRWCAHTDADVLVLDLNMPGTGRHRGAARREGHRSPA